MRVDIVLVESPEDPSLGGPRILGRTGNPRLVAEVRAHLAAERQAELERLQGGRGRVFRVFPGGEDASDSEESE